MTGASRGLGRELALEFSREGYNVIATGRTLSALKNLRNKIPKGRCYIIAEDITKETTIKALEKLAKRVNLDILVNNAGRYSGTLREVMEVNFFAPIKLTQKILPVFKAKERGLIVNINSIAGKQVGKGIPPYFASKHALKGYFESLRFDVIKYGIIILDIYPGGINTSMTNWRKDQNLLMDPKEVAKVIVRNCGLYESLSVNGIDIGRRRYEI